MDYGVSVQWGALYTNFKCSRLTHVFTSSAESQSVYNTDWQMFESSQFSLFEHTFFFLKLLLVTCCAKRCTQYLGITLYLTYPSFNIVNTIITLLLARKLLQKHYNKRILCNNKSTCISLFAYFHTILTIQTYFSPYVNGSADTLNITFAVLICINRGSRLLIGVGWSRLCNL